MRRGELAIQFQHDHGRPPTPIEALHLAQQATLETREAKHEPRSLSEQRATWMSQALAALGGPGAVASMVRTALAPPAEATKITDAQWVAHTASQIVAAMEEHRSTWQTWHVRAEAQRHVRTADVSAAQAGALVDLLVDEVLHGRSVALVAPRDNVEEPEALRRIDGSSVYGVAGADLYTSQRLLDAERRLVDAAEHRDGTTVHDTAVDLALLEMAANGISLDAGQASLVRQMCTSGRRLQLAIAPAGAGKTIAMRALALAWTQDGGDVVGLAPSAAAAAVLGEQTGIGSDTLAKLTWSLQHGGLPDWAARIGPSTLVIIDEAGMADTLSLDTAVQFVIGRGGSVRLVGDDQQLAAIGAGGVLRDIKTQHGAVQLSELHRFTNPAEARATLALRDGDPKALDFYLNQGRVHVGDLATTTEDAFTAWAADRAAGLDAIMLAPTRDLVAELNRRARNHRLNGDVPNAVVRLADGNRASAGDVIITRSNDRRLRLTATDWVKNGDRWTITRIGQNGDLKVRHNRSRLTVRLPAGYVSTRLVSAMPARSTPPKASPPTPCMDSSPARNHGSSCTPCSPVDEPPTTSTYRSSETATRTPSSNPTRSHPARPPRRCSRSSPATTRPPQPPRCCENSATRLPGCVAPSSATLTGSMWRPSSSLDPGSFRCLTPEPTRSCPTSPTSRPGRPCGHTCSHWRRKPVTTRSSTCTQRPSVANSTPQQTWPPCWTGASQIPHPPTQGRFLGFPAFRKHFMIIRSGANIWPSGPNSSPTSPARSEATQAKTQPGLCGRRPTAARTPPSSVKSPYGGPRTPSTPATHDQPEQDGCRQLRPSGNTTSTAVSRAAMTTTSVLTSQSAAPLQPHAIAGTKIDSDCPNHPRSTRTRHPAPAHRRRQAEWVEPPETCDRAEGDSGQPPTDGRRGGERPG